MINYFTLCVTISELACFYVYHEDEDINSCFAAVSNSSPFYCKPNGRWKMEDGKWNIRSQNPDLHWLKGIPLQSNVFEKMTSCYTPFKFKVLLIPGRCAVSLCYPSTWKQFALRYLVSNINSVTGTIRIALSNLDLDIWFCFGLNFSQFFPFLFTFFFFRIL